MSYSSAIKSQAIVLRKQGSSLQEISESLHITKSTASVWLSDLTISDLAQQHLCQKQVLGRKKALLVRKKTADEQKRIALETAIKSLQTLSLSKELTKLCCSLMWWCEGEKTTKYIKFISSDETLVKNFLFFLRYSFHLDNSKFRALIHLHDYHDDQTQKKYWSAITEIPFSQFHKSYQKQSNHIRKKENYPGCIAITYYDAKIAKELAAIYNGFTQLSRGVR